MCNILNIETATDVCSVVLSRGDKILSIRESCEGRSHASLLSVFINELFVESGLQPDDLDAVAVNMGPGSYTGLRIGVSTAKGICYGINKPLIAIPGLESMCSGMINKLLSEKVNFKETVFLPMIDARRMEVYTAFYNSDLTLREDTHASIIQHDSFDELANDRKLTLFGSGADKLVSVLNHVNIQIIPGFKLSALHMVPLAIEKFGKNQFEDVAYFEPNYLKEFITTKSKKKFF